MRRPEIRSHVPLFKKDEQVACIRLSNQEISSDRVRDAAFRGSESDEPELPVTGLEKDA